VWVAVEDFLTLQEAFIQFKVVFIFQLDGVLGQGF